MRLKTFRIQNFRSIVDTDFQDLGPDNITAIIGQNESGKTSILEALEAFESEEISEDDLRDNTSRPEITCIFQSDQAEIENIFKGSEKKLPDSIFEILKGLEWNLEIKRTWEDDLEDSLVNIGDIDLANIFNSENNSNQENSEDTTESEAEDTGTTYMSSVEFAEKIFQNAPFITLFQDKSLLPAKIDLVDLENKNKDSDGYIGTLNFLTLTGLSITDIKKHGDRLIKNKISIANQKFSQDFQKFWSQVLGHDDKICIELDVKNYDGNAPTKIGQTYLSFWIKDKNGYQKPMQRSKGVQWFLSFYLSLKATAKNGEDRIILIDEPGANLHANAQKDILNFLEREKEDLQVVYATHSPYLLDIDKVYRVLAVEREEEGDYTVTKVYSPQKLGSASINTLFPLYTTMGVDISHQQIIEKTNNILLEEISAFYYLKAFQKLLGKDEKVNLLPATGVSNVPFLANLLMGWGIDFGVIVDDDSHGRKIYNELSNNKVVNPDRIYKIKDCDGIEDMFSKKDFSKYVLEASMPANSDKISQFLKRNKSSKPLLARNFLLKVSNEMIHIDNLDKNTAKNIRELFDKVIAISHSQDALSGADPQK